MSVPRATARSVVVLGAGIVGMACARTLQRAGCAVTVIDPAPPGAGCSFGNAGVLAVEHVLPLARPGTLARLPQMLLDAASPLALRPARLPGLAGWLGRFLWACRPTQVARGTAALAALTRRALPAWDMLLQGGAGQALIRRRGLYELYEHPAEWRAAIAASRLAERFGVAVEPVAVRALYDRVPALAPGLAGALYFSEVAHVTDPAALTAALVRAFVEAGGRIVPGAARALAVRDGRVVVALEGAEVAAEHAVIAAGIASRGLCRTLGYDPPLVAEMGYHVAYAPVGDLTDTPIASAAGGFIATPMAAGLRIAGTVELARAAAHPDWRRADVLAYRACRLFRVPLPAPTSRWHGCRPTLPDFLPAIGAVPGVPRVITAFGHQHVGLTTAAVTGALVRDLVCDVEAPLDLTPYAPGRFARVRRPPR